MTTTPEPIDVTTTFEVVVPAGHEARMVLVPQVPDPEVAAIATIRAVLDRLEPAQQRRVVDWAWARWHVGDDHG